MLCCEGGVVRLLEAMEDEHAIYAVLPYLPGHDLHRYDGGKLEKRRLKTLKKRREGRMVGVG
jgi:hypothetical protein